MAEAPASAAVSTLDATPASSVAANAAVSPDPAAPEALGLAAAEATPVAPPPAPTLAAPATMARADHRHCPQVPHPPLLRERGIEGVVHLLVRVSAEGLPAEVRVGTGSGWRRFLPARRGGTPVESWVDFPVRFALGR